MCLDLVANSKDYITTVTNKNMCDFSGFSFSGGFHLKLMNIKL
jgi:hypothetical protein